MGYFLDDPNDPTRDPEYVEGYAPGMGSGTQGKHTGWKQNLGKIGQYVGGAMAGAYASGLGGAGQAAQSAPGAAPLGLNPMASVGNIFGGAAPLGTASGALAGGLAGGSAATGAGLGANMWGTAGKLPTLIGALTGGIGQFQQAKAANEQKKLNEQELAYRKQTDARDFGQRQGELAMEYGQQGNPFAQTSNRARAALVEALMKGYQAPAFDEGTKRWTGGLMSIGPDIFKQILPFYSDTARLGAEETFGQQGRLSAPGFQMTNPGVAGYSPDVRQRLAQALANSQWGVPTPQM